MCGSSRRGRRGFGGAETWLPDPGAIDSSLDHYTFSARSPATRAEAAAGANPDREYRPSPAFGSVTTSDVDTVISASSLNNENYSFDIHLGSFDDEWIETVPPSRGYDQGPEREGLSMDER